MAPSSNAAGSRISSNAPTQASEAMSSAPHCRAGCLPRNVRGGIPWP
jgi:hypothetical protein